MRDFKDRFRFGLTTLVVLSTILSVVVYNRISKEIDSIQTNTQSRIDTLQALLDQQTVNSSASSLWHFLNFLKGDEIIFIKVVTPDGFPLIEQGQVDNNRSMSNILMRQYHFVISSMGVKKFDLIFDVDLFQMSIRVIRSDMIYFITILLLFGANILFYSFYYYRANRHKDLALSLLSKVSTENPDIVSEMESKTKLFPHGQVKSVYENIIGILKKHNQYMAMFLEQSKLVALGNLASQVAHDIRSPLAALDMALKDDVSLPESKRIIVRTATNRIHEIAHELLRKNRAQSAGSEEENVLSKILLSSIIESIVTEKRTQFRSKPNISIQSKLDENSYGIFVSTNTREFKRIISNLINNSVEAFANSSGDITVGIKRLDGVNKKICVEVVDNGKGIPAHIIAKLGDRGVSFGKDASGGSGSGLGIYHAKASVEKWGGQFSISSKENFGTTICITLPEVTHPSTFVPNIRLAAGQKVVILDDDQSIHQIWNGRFESAKSKDSNIEIIHFSTIADCEAWMKSNRADVYLVDYELLGNRETGLDFIERMRIEKQSALVTSRYEETAIQERCERIGVGLIPKGLAPYVPIAIEAIASGPSASTKAEQLDAILIDDDMLVQMIWETKASDKKLKVKVYGDPSEVDFSKLSKDCPIYIDSNLKDGVKGEVIAEKLHKDGFSKIFLATGYEKKHFAHLTFLAGVIGKEPPW